MKEDIKIFTIIVSIIIILYVIFPQKNNEIYYNDGENTEEYRGWIEPIM